MSDDMIKVLVCGESVEESMKTAFILKSAGMFAYTRTNNMESVLQSVINDEPDVVIVDFMMRNFDVISLIQKLNNKLENIPCFIVKSDIKSEFIEKKLIENGISYIWYSPYDKEQIYSVINSLVGKEKSLHCIDAEKTVTDMMYFFGVPPHLKGYNYIRTGVLLNITNHNMISNVTKRLYPEIAKEYGTTPSRVERAIRTAIESTWSKISEEKIESFFGYSFGRKCTKPTNSEFIAFLSEQIIMDFKLGKLNHSKNRRKNSFFS